MSVVWKAFILADLFKRETPPNTGIPAKEIEISDQPGNGKIALITRGKANNGVVGYIEKNSFPTAIGKITYNDQFGLAFYHQYEFTTIKDHLAILVPLRKVFEQMLSKHTYLNEFICANINYILTDKLYNFAYSAADYRFDREIIVLPIMEVTNNDEWIWNEDGEHFYTLAIDYIGVLMTEAKKIKEEKTIKLYEADQLKHETERAKYEAEYQKEKNYLIWKSFKLGELFQESKEHYLEKSKKNYEICEDKTIDFSVAVCAASKYNNGVVGYIQEIDDVPIKKRKGYLTKGGFGHVFFQSDWFIKPGGSWGMLNILKIKDITLKNILDQDDTRYHFFARLLTKIFTGMASWGYSVPLDREVILLPVIEVSMNDEWVWNIDGKYYTLAVSTISYLYFTGQINIQRKKIDTFTCNN